MFKIKQQPKLNQKVTIYVPSTSDINRPTDNTAQVHATAKFLSSLFGGATATTAAGYWIAESGETVQEVVILVYAYTDNRTLQHNMAEVESYCKHLRDDMSQEAISLEINQTLKFI